MDETTSEPRIVSDLISAGDVVMLTTALDGLLARPVTCAEVAGDAISFLVDGTTDWVMALERVEPVAGGGVGITASDPRSSNYASFAARAMVHTDSARAGQLWTPLAQAFFAGPDDPKLRVLDAEVVDGQWWDGPTTGVGRVVSLLGSAILGTPMAGEQGDVALENRAG